MDANKLHVIVPYSNFLRWKSRENHAIAAINHFRDGGAQVLVIECAFGERHHDLAHIPGVKHIGVRAHTLMWNKECLVNLGVSNLPPDAKYVAWVDADIRFRRANWASETVHALQHYDMVQMWSEAIDLGPNGEIVSRHESFGKIYYEGGVILPTKPNMWRKDGGYHEYPHPGFAWAARMDCLERVGGLFELGVSGSGDHHMALALIGEVERSVSQDVRDKCKSLVHHMQVWQDRAQHHINGNWGFVRSEIEHNWHGSKPKRRYWDRWSIFAGNHFNPDTDLKRNRDRVIELAGNKPILRQQIDQYMRSRDEDSNTLA